LTPPRSRAATNVGRAPCASSVSHFRASGQRAPLGSSAVTYLRASGQRAPLGAFAVSCARGTRRREGSPSLTSPLPAIALRPACVRARSARAWRGGGGGAAAPCRRAVQGPQKGSSPALGTRFRFQMAPKPPPGGVSAGRPATTAPTPPARRTREGAGSFSAEGGDQPPRKVLSAISIFFVSE